MITFLQFLAERDATEPQKSVWWHGSPSGDLRGGRTGLHLGTKKAATEALTARIGHPVEGEWDGTREYGKTKLAGKRTLRTRGISITGHNVDSPEEDYYPHEHPKVPTMGASAPVEPSHRPGVKPYHLVGPMSNAAHRPHDDFKANGYMAGQLKKGTAKRGYYYKNVGEDAGSLSIVVPGPGHIKPAE